MEDALEIALASPVDREVPPLDFDRLVRGHQQRIYRVLLGLVRDAGTADDLTQECFVRAFRSRELYRGEAAVGTWLVSIAINVARDHQRNRRAGFWRRLFKAPPEDRDEALAVAQTSEASAEQRLIASEELARVWSLVGELAPRQREVFVLRFAEELSLEEIATATGTEVGTVKAHLSRAVGTIRKRVKEDASQRR